MKKVAVLTSGGDAPGMNAAIRALTRTCLNLGMDVYGVENGYLGLYNNNIFQLKSRDVSDIINRGGTFLKTARFADFMKDEVCQHAALNLLNQDIEYLVVIGGEGSYKGAQRISKFGIKVICIPATIDNDVQSTKLAVGHDSATNTVVEAIDRIKDNSSSHSRCSIIEVMGRNCGEIALRSGIASGVEEVFIDKDSVDLDKICSIVEARKISNHNNTLFVMVENICDIIELAQQIEERTNVETRSTILGYIQRGGSPSALDRYLASEFGSYAGRLIAAGKYNLAIGSNGIDFYDTALDEALILEIHDVTEMLKLSDYLK
ncbi:6-phosphofructokinase [Erysipelotrichaceae bacterium OttesenSCG-928-M19]|nr:6-phosphofructokinase [Erysipelotrichaceae bacterium OttesenSCG-928-M19]